MNFLEMQQHVAQLVGDEDYVQFKQAQIKRYINMGLRYVASQMEALQTTVGSAVLDAVVNRPGGLILSTAFQRVVEVRVGTTGTPIPQIDWAEVYQLPLNGTIPDTGDPTAYYITNLIQVVAGPPSVWSRRLEFYPSQPQGKNLQVMITYIGVPSDLTGDSDTPHIPEPYHEMICLYALARCKIQETDYEGARFVMNDVESRLLEARYEIGPSTATQFGMIRNVAETSSIFTD